MQDVETQGQLGSPPPWAAREALAPAAGEGRGAGTPEEEVAVVVETLEEGVGETREGGVGEEGAMAGGPGALLTMEVAMGQMITRRAVTASRTSSATSLNKWGMMGCPMGRDYKWEKRGVPRRFWVLGVDGVLVSAFVFEGP